MRRLLVALIVGLLGFAPQLAPAETCVYQGGVVTGCGAQLNQANTWTALQTFSAGVTVSGGVVQVPNGTAAAPAIRGGDADTGIWFRNSGNEIALTWNGTTRALFVMDANPPNFVLGSNWVLGFANATDAATGSLDTILLRDSANTLALRNSTNAQEFRWYRTYTDASNYERGKLNTPSAGIIEIAGESAGTGSANIDLKLSPKGTGRVLVNTALNTAVDGGSTAAFLANAVGSTGGPTTAAQNGWLLLKDSAGADIWVPVWK